MKNGVKFVKNSKHFRASFPEVRGAAEFHQKFQGIFHGDFHGRFQDKISRQHFCKPCRGDMSQTLIIRHTIMTRTFFSFENYLPAKASNVIHTKLPKGLLMVVSKRWFEFCPESKFPYPLLTSIQPPFLPQFNLFFTFFNLNLASASSGISNHG